MNFREQTTQHLKITQYNGEPCKKKKPNKTQSENNSVQWTIEKKKNCMNWGNELKMTSFFSNVSFFPSSCNSSSFFMNSAEKKKETGKKCVNQ